MPGDRGFVFRLVVLLIDSAADNPGGHPSVVGLICEQGRAIGVGDAGEPERVEWLRWIAGRTEYPMNTWEQSTNRAERRRVRAERELWR